MLLPSWLSLHPSGPPRRLVERHRARLRLELLEDRTIPSGMSLVGQWNGDGSATGHDETPVHLFADLWAEQVRSGPFAGRSFAYIGHYGSQGGIDILEITNPSEPTLAARFVGIGGDNELVDVQVQNGIGYFSSDNATAGGVFIVDVTNPYAPSQLARIDPANGGFRHVHTLFVDGRYLYQAGWVGQPGEVRIFDVSNPASPLFVRSIPTPDGKAVHEVTVRNGRLYTARGFEGGPVHIFDVSRVGELTAPVPLLGSFRAGDAVHTSLASEDGRFLITTHEFAGHPLEIYNVSNPAAPKLVSSIHVPRSQAYTAHQPMVVGNLLYVAWYEAGVRVYDIADPSAPQILGDFDTYKGPYGHDGECAGLFGGNHGVNTDADPYPIGCGAWGVYPSLGNDRILVSDFDGGLIIVSLDNPPPALTAAAAAARPGRQTLAAMQVQPLLTGVLARWGRASPNTSSLDAIDIHFTNLGGLTLGLAAGHTIWLDDNAAGWGWFVDPTPGNDSEFATPGNQGEQNRMDLLTVLAHELGHLLGFEHGEPGASATGDMLQETLSAGKRLALHGVNANDFWWFVGLP